MYAPQIYPQKYKTKISRLQHIYRQIHENLIVQLTDSANYIIMYKTRNRVEGKRRVEAIDLLQSWLVGKDM
jgi:hypothetical protein